MGWAVVGLEVRKRNLGYVFFYFNYPANFMNQNCIKCTDAPEMVLELLNLYNDGDLTRIMEILFDLTSIGVKQNMLSDTDLDQLSLLIHLVGATSKSRELDQKTEISL